MVEQIDFPFSVYASLDYIGAGLDGRVAVLIVVTENGIKLVHQRGLDRATLLEVYLAAQRAIATQSLDMLREMLPE